MNMFNLFNSFITKIKGEEFRIDSKVPYSYMVSLLISNILRLVKGYTIFRKSSRAFISYQSRIICRKMISFGDNLRIDRGVFIDALSINGISFGKNVSIGKYTTIECSGTIQNIGVGLIVGNNVGMGTHGYWGCAGGIKVGDDTIFGNYVSLHSENHFYKSTTMPIRLQGVEREGISIGRNCWIGAKVTILDGVIIEDGCIIAAGSVLVRVVYKKNSIYGGIPAKFLKER